MLTDFRVADACARAGLDPVKQTIPVAAAAHYHMGGVAVDQRGRSSLAGLWVCGEAASTGLHGANRLASNGVLEALVFARACAPTLRHGSRQTLRRGSKLRSGAPALRRTRTRSQTCARP